MPITTSVEWPQYQIGYEPRQEEPPDLIYPVIPFMYLHANVIPYLWLIENERPDVDSMYVLRERGRNLPNLDFDFSLDNANGLIPRIQSDVVSPLMLG